MNNRKYLSRKFIFNVLIFIQVLMWGCSRNILPDSMQNDEQESKTNFEEEAPNISNAPS